MDIVDMRMLRWMCGLTSMDAVRNQNVREKLGVSPLSKNLRENKLRWFRHVKRKTAGAPVILRMVENLIVEGKRSRGRPKRKWEKQLKFNMCELHLSEGLTRDKNS